MGDNPRENRKYHTGKVHGHIGFTSRDLDRYSYVNNKRFVLKHTLIGILWKSAVKWSSMKSYKRAQGVDIIN